MKYLLRMNWYSIIFVQKKWPDLKKTIYQNQKLRQVH